MQFIVTDRVRWSVVGLSLTVLSPSKAAEPIEMLFGLWPRMGLKNHVLDINPDFPMGRGIFEKGYERSTSCKVEGHSAVSCATSAQQ